MKILMTTAIAAATIGAGAAQAAVFSYDVALERQSLRLAGISGGFFTNDPSTPPVPGLECRATGAPAPEGLTDVSCQGSANFQNGVDNVVFDDIYGPNYLDRYPKNISASFILDSNYTVGNESGRAPTCSGSEFVCDFVTGRQSLLFDNGIREVSDEGFYVLPGSQSYLFEFDETGIFYQDDAVPTFTVNGIFFSSNGGLQASYTATSLEIAPVPLPASLPLLALGVGAMAFVRRKRRGAPASN